VEQLGQESSHLVTAFPDARTHVERKHNEMLLAWRQLIDKSTQRRERLNLAESLQSYLNKYREFSLWISEMLAIITSYDLPQDVRRAESLLVRHKEHRAEIESRFDQFSQIRKEGLQVIQRGHFMADEIKDKVERLEKGYDSLMDVWKRRNELYALNLDVQV
jgi:spectrin beta